MDVSRPLPLTPYRGALADLSCNAGSLASELERAAHLPSIQLGQDAILDLELLATGALSPLDHYPTEQELTSILRSSRLPNGLYFPYPLSLASESRFDEGAEITLRDAHNVRLAILRVGESFEQDTRLEAEAWGIEEAKLPNRPRFRLSGRPKVLALPHHPDFPHLRRSPRRMREELTRRGCRTATALSTAEFITVPEFEALQAAADGAIIVQVIEKALDARAADHFARVRAHRMLLHRHGTGHTAILNVLPYCERPHSERAVLTQALIQRNYGAGRLLADCTSLDSNKLSEGAAELGVEITPVERDAGVLPPEVEAVKREAMPPRHAQGFCVWFTGLPSSGKSTIANVLYTMLAERGRRSTLLDGDVVRTHLSKGLGFSREDRDANILRIAFVAGEIVRHHGAVICAAVSPYEGTRQQARRMVGDDHFVLVHVATPQEICERRDVKGFYARARTGTLQGFTGVDDPYESPGFADLTLETTTTTAGENARRILTWLADHGFLQADENAGQSSGRREEFL